MKRLLLLTVCCAALLVEQRAWGQTDACPGTLIACGAVVAGNTTAFTVDNPPVCGTTSGTGGGVWFRFVGTGNPVVASLCGSGYDTKIRVYTGACGALVCTVGNDDLCGLQSQVSWVSVLGTTYHILVHGFGGATGAYTLTITCPTPMCYAQTAVPYAADPYAGTALTLTDDVHSPVVNIGFTFCFNGTNYTQCVISSNNYITFNLANAGLYSPYITVAIPSGTPAQPHNAVLDPWQDINPGVGGSVFYQTLGVAPYRRFVVSYLNVPMFLCTGQLYSSQIVLYERTNCIESLILSKPICATWNNGNAVQGLQNNGGTSATTVLGRNNTQWTATAEGRFFSPTCAPCSTAYTANCTVVPLPIELLSFTGRNNGGANVLEWATASEQNSARFEVERSADGDMFEPIITVEAAGNSNGQIDYLTKDGTPHAGMNYYRLRSIDTDGTEDVSTVIAVDNTTSSGILIHPNPAHGSAYVQLPQGTPMPATLVVLDLSGRVVRRSVVHATGQQIAIEGLARGTYVLEVQELGATVRFGVE